MADLPLLDAIRGANGNNYANPSAAPPIAKTEDAWGSLDRSCSRILRLLRFFVASFFSQFASPRVVIQTQHLRMVK
jgi:hypothetical protein